ncbi:hypothetical protein OsI_12550 [Oryza sativa Indica Group]|uniref:Uncharacterized protein n=1 Tax=Oryza sativa subsp. indica TaxID=39946 RepID=A2XJC6_ORYSI|nr:hypothetical protein OsI_12550 [Oryza sativa Indica Group]
MAVELVATATGGGMGRRVGSARKKTARAEVARPCEGGHGSAPKRRDPAGKAAATMALGPRAAKGEVGAGVASPARGQLREAGHGGSLARVTEGVVAAGPRRHGDSGSHRLRPPAVAVVTVATVAVVQRSVGARGDVGLPSFDGRIHGRLGQILSVQQRMLTGW